MTGGITLKSWCRRMREYLTADDICNQLSMNRSVFKGNILLSEGNTDQRLFNKFIDKKISETHIVIDPMFKDCDFSRAGWAEKIRN